MSSRNFGWALVLGGGLLLFTSAPSYGQYCYLLIDPLRAGLSNRDIAQRSGLTEADVAFCRRELSRPVLVGPPGMSPHEAIGVPPSGAVGPPPHGAIGPPPFGAMGPPPSSREVKRLP